MAVARQAEYSGICDFCFSTICTAGIAWGLHHGNYQSHMLSVQEGCLFCTILHEDYSKLKLDSGILQLHDLWPLYRFNIRQVQPVRESQPTIILTFRPVLPTTLRDLGSAIDSLSERTFHFYLEASKLCPATSHIDGSF